MMNKWRERREDKKKKRVEKYKKPSLEEKLKELERKHGGIERVVMKNGKLHYHFIDGAIVYFNSTFTGMQTVYVNKGFIYNI